jgi:hypothetical protein
LFGYIQNNPIKRFDPSGLGGFPGQDFYNSNEIGGAQIINQVQDLENAINSQVTSNLESASLEGIAIGAGAIVTYGTGGNVCLGLLTHDAVSIGFDFLTGNTGNIPIPGTPLSVPEGIHPPLAY